METCKALRAIIGGVSSSQESEVFLMGERVGCGSNVSQQRFSRRNEHFLWRLGQLRAEGGGTARGELRLKGRWGQTTAGLP